MKKLLLIIFLFLIIDKVNAQTYEDNFYYDTERVENVWITREKGDLKASGIPYVLKRVKDNRYVYCIEPFELLKSDSVYTGYDYNETIFNLPDSSIERINLLAYYGYQYTDHTDIKWYAVTQYLIWKEVEPTANIYFADGKYGNQITLYEEEINELNSLVEKHYLLPSYSSTNVIASINEKQKIIDDNNVDVSQFIFDIPNDVNIQKDNNELYISSSKAAIYNIKIIKEAVRYDSKYVIYYNGEGQNLFLPGNYNSIESQFYFHAMQGTVTIFNRSTRNINLGNITYGIYKDDELLELVETNTDGMAYIDGLEFGDNYSLKLIKDDKVISIQDIVIAPPTINHTVVVNLDEITSTLTVIRKHNSMGVGDVLFEILEDGFVTHTVMTLESGEGVIALPIGDYTVREYNGASEPYEFSIDGIEPHVYTVNTYEEIIEEKEEISKHEEEKKDKVIQPSETEVSFTVTDVSIDTLENVNEIILVPDTLKNDYSLLIYLILGICGTLTTCYAIKM